MTQYSARGSMPSVSIMSAVSRDLDAPMPTSLFTATTITAPSSVQSEASDNSYTGRVAVARFEQLEPDYTTLNMKINCKNGTVSFGASFYPADSKAIKVEQRRKEVANKMGIATAETRLTKARLAKMIMPCIRAGNPQAYTKISAQTYGPLAHCVLDSISANTLSSRLRVVIAEDGETKLVMYNFDLAEESPIPGDGECKFGIAVLHKLREKYPQLYPQFTDYMDQEDLEAALESDDLEEISDAEEAITQEFEKFVVDKLLPLSAPPPSPQNMAKAPREELLEQATKDNATSSPPQPSPLTTTPALIENKPDEQKGEAPPRDAQSSAATDLEPIVPSPPQSTEGQTEKAPACNSSALAKKKRGANEAGFNDEKSPKRLKDDSQDAASNDGTEDEPVLDAFDLLNVELGITNKEPANHVEDEVAASKKRNREDTGSDDTQVSAGSKKKPKTLKDDARTKNVHDDAMFAFPAATGSEKQTAPPASLPQERTKKDAKPNQRPLAPAKPSPSSSASTSPSGAGSTASVPSTGRTTPQSASGASPPPKPNLILNLLGNNSSQHLVRGTKSDSGKPRSEQKPKATKKKADQPELEHNDLLTVEEQDETTRLPLQKPTFQQSAPQKKTNKRKASEVPEGDVESDAKKPKKEPKQKVLPGPSPFKKGVPRPADCPTEKEVGIAWWNKKEGLGGDKHYPNITNKGLTAYLAYHGIEFTAKRVDGGRPYLIARVEEISPGIKWEKEEEEKRNNRRRPVSPPQQSERTKKINGMSFSKN